MMYGEHLPTKQASIIIGITPGYLTKLIRDGRFTDFFLDSSGHSGRPSYWVNSLEVEEFARLRAARRTKVQPEPEPPKPVKDPMKEVIHDEIVKRMNIIIDNLCEIEDLLQKLEGS